MARWRPKRSGSQGHLGGCLPHPQRHGHRSGGLPRTGSLRRHRGRWKAAVCADRAGFFGRTRSHRESSGQLRLMKLLSYLCVSLGGEAHGLRLAAWRAPLRDYRLRNCEVFSFPRNVSVLVLSLPLKVYVPPSFRPSNCFDFAPKPETIMVPPSGSATLMERCSLPTPLIFSP